MHFALKMEIKGSACGLSLRRHTQNKPSSAKMIARTVTPINQGWTFRQADDDSSKFLPVAQFPTNIHLDLIHHGIIPDPFMGKNENDVQWVGEKDWIYKTSFSSPKNFKEARAVLAFDGLDTHATVVLNGEEILKAENMFIPERVDVTKVLRSLSDNDLKITFHSTWFIGKKLVENYPDHKWGCWNGDASRLAVRKAQYHYVLPSSPYLAMSRLKWLIGVGLGSDADDLRALETHKP